MQIKKADLLQVAVRPAQYPPAGPPEIAFAGRSNVGKSSLLNLLTNRRHLARVSGSPGKTQTINFYSINDDEFRIVDLPGYGYAKVSRSITEKWGEMVDAYLLNREALKAVCLLVDIRREPTAMDTELFAFLAHHGLAGPVIATKSDKVSRGAYAGQAGLILSTLGAADTPVIPVSALKRTGVEDLLEAINEFL
ncbi:MAG: ribosome biogenesis GTP-binding protein YihA/YsxC [Clostridiales Family XIII bacterium]|jgi:GTP-binding protein|nr:ribosome biogenesis GTP-binding protein YihA/YsxC [Clostridiales Family XIII bacterium]